MVEGRDYCQRCKKTTNLLRCSRCRSVFYCSRDCQKLDWKAGHRKRCRAVTNSAPTTKVLAAWQELHDLCEGLSLSEADENFHKSIREIERLKEVEKSLADCGNNGESLSKPALAKVSQRQEPRHTEVVSSDGNPDDKNTDPIAIDRIPLNQLETIAQTRLSSLSPIKYVVEKMLQISCYQIRLISPPTCSIYNDKNVLVLHRVAAPEDVLIRLMLPGVSEEQLKETTIITDGDGHVNIRIPICGMVDPDDFTIPFAQASTTLNGVNTIRCRPCGQSLIKPDSITTILPLPSNNWDEITDYLSCYNGPTSIDFTSVSTIAKPGLAMEDSSVLVFHEADLGESVCPLAVEAYGQDSGDFETDDDDDSTQTDSVLNRGTRKWRNMVSGATLCCSQCCVPLGVASGESLETLRLWKHRLTMAGDENVSTHPSIGTFLASEMIRYANSKAVFTFIVVMPSLQQTWAKRPCLLLRLLRWDTRLALGAESSRNEHGIDCLHFRRFAKVIYEETVEPNGSELMVTNWKWGNIDLCCPTPQPLASLESKERATVESLEQASVRICLPTEEWHELRRSLREGSNLFSTDVAKATIIVKIGKLAAEGDAVGLSILPLI